ncbi:sugar phosphate isomerase/epimerase family protein [Pimelobacter simplex]|uniref:sugar phosphate isomerase/epimerase family protein n=1 Tax=Nocardioides simplex TaxID=2045 RepID=UPI00214FD2C2|nr:sugar phosphate isomerase/epimerase [Pimelobacter simplex]UUW91677.1 sugar phosphate isomerase/epimerase [Pimelobacter simplex]UUW95505.1 sugar phosphate isomerase/epimerase [Pimelobacter simplex]
MTSGAGRSAGGPGGRPRIGLSTSSVYPESTAHAFAYAASVGYEAVEVMVGIDALSQQTDAVRQLSDHHDLPISAIHAPCLLFTQRVWGVEPWGKLERSAATAKAVGAEVVVVHPPFRWQREYARDFVNGIAALEESSGIAFAVENMYPWRASKRRMEMYLPSWDPSEEEYANTTIDLSHAAIAQSDPVAMAERLGRRLRHIHLTDGTDSAKDEHLVPGRGDMGAAAFLRHLATTGFAGEVVLEINTRRCTTREEREADLRESLEFAVEHLTVVPAEVEPGGDQP